jgi:hypothetical protein
MPIDAVEVKLAEDVSFTLQSQPLKSQIFDVPDDALNLYFSIARCTSKTPDVFPDPHTHVGIQLFMSKDNGPWINLAGFYTCGGVMLDGDGNESPESFFPVSINPKDELFTGVNRKCRVSFVTFEGTPPELKFNFFAK